MSDETLEFPARGDTANSQEKAEDTGGTPASNPSISLCLTVVFFSRGDSKHFVLMSVTKLGWVFQGAITEELTLN